MQECQDQARDQMKPGFENDAKKMAKVEEALINCMASTVDKHIKLLPSMSENIRLLLLGLKKK